MCDWSCVNKETINLNDVLGKGSIILLIVGSLILIYGMVYLNSSLHDLTYVDFGSVDSSYLDERIGILGTYQNFISIGSLLIEISALLMIILMMCSWLGWIFVINNPLKKSKN